MSGDEDSRGGGREVGKLGGTCGVGFDGGGRGGGCVCVCVCVWRRLREGRASQEELQAASTGQEFRMLDEVFSAFDSAVESYGMFKYQHVRWRPRRSKHRVL